MKLHALELQIDWPPDIELSDLRLWLLKHIGKYGEPLRWSITSIESDGKNHTNPKLKIEAVVITMKLSN